MANASIVKQRLSAFLKSTGSNNNQFIVRMGYAPTFLNSDGGISENKLSKIAETYPELDMNWLLTGSGFMLKNISENSENLSKQSENDSRNSIDEIIEEKIKKAIMENIPAIISAVMEGMNKQMEGQNQVINKQLDMLQEVIRSLADLNTKSDRIHENVVKLSRKAQ